MKRIFTLLVCLLPLFLYAQTGIGMEEESPESEQLLLDMERLNDMLKPINDKGDALEEEVKKKGNRIYHDEAYREEVIARFDELRIESLGVMKQFAQENPNSEVSLHVIYEMIKANADYNEVEALFASLTKEKRESEPGLKLKAQLDKLGLTAIGAMAPDFTQADANNKPVNLKDFRGKYVLVDFWASWCGPCRKENRSLVKAYNKFKGKNFEIVGVSLDSLHQKQSWQNAIRNDKLVWTQVSDLAGWENEVAQQYGITAIPQNFLLDPQGVIVGRNLRGEALIKKLTELLE